MKSSISFSKKTLFSQRVSSASMRRVFRRIANSLAVVQRRKKSRYGCARFTARLSRGFSGAGGEFFEHGPGYLLEFAESRNVVLEFRVHQLRFIGLELDAHDHVSQLHGMREECVFIEFFECDGWIVVIHVRLPIEKVCCARACLTLDVTTGRKWYGEK